MKIESSKTGCIGDPAGVAAKRRSRRKRLLLIVALAVLAPVTFVTIFLFTEGVTDNDQRVPLRPGMTNDASGLEAAKLRRIHRCEGSFDEAVRNLRGLLRDSARAAVAVSIGGARHSMGGHSIAPGGVQIDMLPFRAMQLDASRQVLTVQAGARWIDVIRYLDPFGYSPKVMQSNSDFTVGGSVSVNCHGWQPGCPPIAHTVRSLRLMNAAGEVVRCSRQENAELFALVLGGYGLFGVILDLDLLVVENAAYSMRIDVLSKTDFLAAFPPSAEALQDVGLLFGRLCISPGSRFEDAILGQLMRTDRSPQLLSELEAPAMGGVRRTVFRASVGSDFGKRLRWTMEKAAMQMVNGQPFTRNQLLSESSEVYGNRKAEWSDILHEYFLPKAELSGFLAELRAAVKRHGVDLLNVTVRDVRADETSFLRYARTDLVALVLLFSMARNLEADRVMAGFTESVIDSALAHGGCYYLPYRLHGTVAQFAEAYPMAREFFEAKRRYDPGELFVNRFYLRYGRK